MRALLPALTLLSLAGPAVAQSVRPAATRVVLSAGRLQYDAGGDRWYPMMSAVVDHRTAAPLRLGVGASWVKVGAVDKGYNLPASSNERLLRGFLRATALTQEPFHQSRVPVVDRLSPYVGADVGVVHSSGVAYTGPDPSLPTTIRNQPTGMFVGAHGGFDVRLSAPVSMNVGLSYYRDHLYGGPLDDLSEHLGLAIGF